MRGKKVLFAVTVSVLVSLPTASTDAHWCSNIFGAYARLVIKPEQTTVNISGSNPAQLKVHLQNNFPYKLFNVEMRGEASGYTIDVSPNGQDVHPGQQVEYTYSISGSAGDVQVSTLNLQVRFRYGGWQGENDKFVNQSPSQNALVSASSYGSSEGEQSPSLNAAILADQYPSATIGSMLNRTGIEQLIHWFGYRFCYNSSGSYRCGNEDCPSPCAVQDSWHWSSIEQFPQNCMRAGVDLAIRKAKLGSKLQAARDGATNALKGNGSAEHECLAAVVGGYLHSGASDTSAFESALNEVSSACRDAGLRALGKGSQGNCGSGQFYEKAACAAAEGLQGNDGPVTNILMANAGDGDSQGGYTGLYYSYMLYIVSGDRIAAGSQPSFYPSVGPPPPPPPQQDSGTSPQQDSGQVPPPPPPPGVDADPPPGFDAFGPPLDDSGNNPGVTGSDNILEGGCGFAVDTRASLPALALVMLLLAGLWLRSRSR